VCSNCNRSYIIKHQIPFPLPLSHVILSSYNHTSTPEPNLLYEPNPFAVQQALQHISRDATFSTSGQESEAI